MIVLYKIMKNIKSKFFFNDENTTAFFTMARYSIDSNVEFFYTDILNNEFIISDPENDSEEYQCELNKFIDLYCYSKKILNTLKKFFRTIKYKKYKKYQMDTDLYFNDLSKFPSYQKITILENNTLYTFRLSDLIVIMVDSLSTTEGLFPIPKKSKNPYTNIYFSVFNLYNIYFALLNSTFHIPLLINKFYLSGFSIKIFLNSFFPHLKDICIKKFITEGTITEKYGYIENMFFDYRKEINWSYLPSKNTMIYSEIQNYCNKLNKSLYNYLMYKYSNNNWTKDKYNDLALDMIKKFTEDYPELIYRSRSLPSTTLRRRSINRRITNTPPPPTISPPPIPRINNRAVDRGVQRRALQELVQEIDLSLINSNAVDPFLPSRQLRRTPSRF